MLLVLALNVEPYCLPGSALEIVSPGLGFQRLCMTEMAGSQGALILLMRTGRQSHFSLPPGRRLRRYHGAAAA